MVQQTRKIAHITQLGQLTINIESKLLLKSTCIYSNPFCVATGGEMLFEFSRFLELRKRDKPSLILALVYTCKIGKIITNAI